MANERTYAILPCKELDESIAFYETLGFKRTYRQLRPNPAAIVALEDIYIHLGCIEGFIPENSYGSVIITVPDPEALYHSFAAGLRQAYGKLPVAGIPRILRPRKKYGTISGFSVIDPGGNWLRIYKTSEAQQEASLEKEEGLAQIILVAARLADARGDEAGALKTLENGLARYHQAAPVDRAKAYLYQVELAVRTKNNDLAHSSLALASALQLTDVERNTIADEFDYAATLLSELDS
jgi:hypothetical protein